MITRTNIINMLQGNDKVVDDFGISEFITRMDEKDIEIDKKRESGSCAYRYR